MQNSSLYQQLCEYKSFVNGNKLYGFSLFDQRKDKTKIALLYQLIDKNRSEVDIAIELGYNNNKDTNYQKLSRRLLKKLSSSLFFLDDTKSIFSDLGLKYYKLLKETFQHRTLIMLRKRNLSMHNIEKLVSEAHAYEFPDLVLYLTSELIPYFSYIQTNDKKLQYYLTLADVNQKKYVNELQIYRHYSLLSKAYLQKSTDLKSVIQLLKEYLEKYDDLDPSFMNHRSILFDFQLKSLLYQLTEQYDKLIILSDKTLAFLDSKPYETYFINYMIKVDLTNAYKNLEKYRVALKINQQIINDHKSIDYNWYRLLSTRFNLFILIKDYSSAYKIVADIKKKLKKTSLEKVKEEWNIKEAYINFLLELGYIDHIIVKKYPLSEFRLNRFLNDVPVYSKQKRSLNISILIVQMLFYLQQKHFNAFIDRMDALNQYAYRYLRNDDTLRSNCFIKMLLKIPDAHYHPVAVQRHVKKYYNKLVDTPPPVSDQTSDVEIIPYEDLWEMVLELLEKNR